MLAETIRTSTALPGAPLTSFFDSLSPLQKQLLLQQQFQQGLTTVNEDSQKGSLFQSLSNNKLSNFQPATDIWFPVCTYENKHKKWNSFLIVYYVAFSVF